MKMKTNETTMVTTRDNENVLAESALTLNWDGVLARKLSVPKGPMQDAIQAILNDLRKDPTLHAVSSEETEHAKKLNQLLGAIKVKRQPVPPLWVSYSEAYANWLSRQGAAKSAEKPATNDDAKNAAIAAVRARAQAKLDKERAQVKANADAAQALAGLSVSATEADAKRKEREAEEARLAEIIGQYALGRARVNQNSRPTGLVVGKNGIGLSFAQDIAASIPDGCDPASTLVPCVFCGHEHALGDNFTKKGAEKPTFRMHLLWLPARTQDGTQDYVNLKGDYEGQPKKLPVLACSKCSGIAYSLAKAECPELPEDADEAARKMARAFMPNSGPALDLVQRAYLKAKAERDAQRGTQTTLRANFEERTKGGRRDRRTHRHDEE
jgi:hypothetical protein